MGATEGSLTVGTADDGASDIQRAKRIVRGQEQDSPAALLALALRLIDRHEFGTARKLLRRAREGGRLSEAEEIKARQQQALSTYKDPDLPVAARLRRALEVLADGEDLETTTTAETLCLAGAIHKRRWEATLRSDELERSLDYYRRAYEQGLADDGYAAINAAFILDLLADLATTARDGVPDAGTVARRAEAAAIRREIVDELAARAEREPGSWWLQATLAEACLGLGRYDEARGWLARCAAIADVPAWQIESTARQLGALARLRAQADGGDVPQQARDALRVLLGDREDAVTRAYAGKLGLALSGGGFRAALFHIGVLAHLAETDVLRHVEVLSCVSGGSIVGAHYYLEVQRLLEAEDEREITRDDYVKIVRRIEERFVAGVRSNIRMRVMGNPISNLRAVLSKRWTRTRYAGELYERQLYSRVDDGRGARPRYMHDLLFTPHGEPGPEPSGRPSFNPKRDNWRRRCKVPILVLNATTLNTGHNWQFTASWMGEPPAVVDEDIDTNPRLRRMYYSEAPPRWRDKVRLGEAVAASACVPGIFEPLVLDGLYPDTSVELVDGGAHDNQGVASLIEQECSAMLVSDASGQMTHIDDPRDGPVAVPLRASSILSARVREAQLRDLLAREASSALRSLGMIHLRKGLGEPPRDWIGSPDAYDPADDVLADGGAPDYGIDPGVQKLLAGLRTDLDTFSPLEANALMLSGYRMARASFDDAVASFGTSAAAAEGEWGFLAVTDATSREGPAQRRLERVLAVGADRWWKVWRLSPALRRGATGLALAALVGAFLALRGPLSLAPSALAIAALAIVVVAVLAAVASRRDVVGVLLRVATGLVLVAATIPAWIQIRLLDPLYERAGRLSDD